METKHFFLTIALCTGITLGTYAQKDGTVNSVNANGSTVLVCNLAKVNKQETILLSELVNKCELIRFDDVDEALFKAWTITATDNYIGVRQSGKPFKLFNRSGKYLCDIGKIGNGPGEYNISIYDEIIDEKNGRIYFAPFTGDKIMVYNIKGEFIKDIKLPYRLQKPKIELTDASKGILTIAHMPFKGDKAFAFQIDGDGKILKEVAPTEKILAENFDGELFSFRNNGAFDIHHTSLDTLYHLNTKDLTLKPLFSSLPPNGEEGWIRLYRELPGMYLTNAFNWKNQESMTVITRTKTQTSKKARLVNDYYGNLEMPFLAFNKGYFLFNAEPGLLMEMIEKRMKESDCSKADKEKLQKLLGTLDENSNDILFLGKLK